MIYTDGLETPRLITRFLTQEDVIPWLEYCRDPECTRFTAFPGKTPEELAQFFIDRAIARYAEGTYGVQGLISKESGELVGMCGIMVQIVNNKAEVEVGYHLIRRHWGKGYATEATIAFRDYGFENNVADSLVSIIDPKNMASKKVAGRMGMKLVVKNVLFRDEAYNLFRITRREWELLSQK
jgi:[ribosomal protein S5]-alanine N-acetyltransferase